LVNRIAVLGWGSLIWDRRADFDGRVGDWDEDGPQLALEFCRVSESRAKALTLVIDGGLGTPVKTLYAISKRTDINDVISDLRSREGTSTTYIGSVDRISAVERGRDARAIEVIRSWADTKGIQSVVWTDLPSNFPEQEPNRFIDVALTHLRSLPMEDRWKAVEYIVKAPSQITTRLRSAIMGDHTLKAHISEYLRAQGVKSV